MLETIVTEIGPVKLVGIGFSQFVVAISAVYLIYRAREHSVTGGAFTGVGLPTIIVATQYVLGRELFALTIGELVPLVLVSVVAGGTGVALAATVLEPEIDEPTSTVPNRTLREVNDG